ncbi:hypothetical protein Fot_36594 [Forsythia ovata]|uniref:Uncharacterized protein n=1 Tax=Forsythia ovata TaxID=205694 RepID=A0ABD1SPV3_9LAMI
MSLPSAATALMGTVVWTDFSRGRISFAGGMVVGFQSREHREVWGKAGGRERMEDLTGLGAGEGRLPATEMQSRLGRRLGHTGREKKPWSEMQSLEFFFFPIAHR